MNYDQALKHTQRASSELQKLTGEQIRLRRIQEALKQGALLIASLDKKLKILQEGLEEEFENGGSNIDSLSKEVGQVTAELTKAKKEQASIANDLDSIAKELEHISLEKETLLKSLEVPAAVIAAYDKTRAELPGAYMRERCVAYEAALKSREDKLKIAKEGAYFEAMDAVEKEVLPVWKMIQDALRRDLYPTIDKGIIARVQKAFALIPQHLNPTFKAELNASVSLLSSYQETSEEYSKLPDGSMKVLKREQLLQGRDRLAGLARLDTSAFEKARSDFKEKTVPKVEEETRPAILAGERRIAEVLHNDSDRKALTDAKVGEVEVVKEHPFIQEMRTPEGRLEFITETFRSLGIPTSFDEFEAAMKSRREKNALEKTEAEENAKKSKGNPVGVGRDDLGLLEQLGDDIMYRIDPVAVPKTASSFIPGTAPQTFKSVANRENEAKARVGLSGMKGPSDTARHIVEAAIDPTKPAKENVPELTKLLMAEFIAKLGNAKKKEAVSTKEKFKEALDTLESLSSNFYKVFTGEFQQEQATAKLKEADRLSSPEECIQAIAKAEGKVTYVDPVKAQKRAEAKKWVSDFELSLKKVEGLEKEVNALNHTSIEIDKTYAKTYDVTVHIGELRMKLAPVKALKSRIEALKRERGTAEDSRATENRRNKERQVFMLARDKEIVLCTKKIEDTKRTLATSIEKLSKQIALEAIVKNQEVIKAGKALIADLESPTLSIFEKDHFRKPGSDNLRLLQNVTFDNRGTKTLLTNTKGRQTALDIIDVLKHASYTRPLAANHDFVIPASIKYLTLEELAQNPDTIRTAYGETLQKINLLASVCNQFSALSPKPMVIKGHWLHELKAAYNELETASHSIDPREGFLINSSFDPDTTSLQQGQELLRIAHVQVRKLIEKIGGTPPEASDPIKPSCFVEPRAYLGWIQSQIALNIESINRTLATEQQALYEHRQALSKVIESLKEMVKKQEDISEIKLNGLSSFQEKVTENEEAIAELEENLELIKTRDIEKKLVDEFDAETDQMIAEIDPEGITENIEIWSEQLKHAMKLQEHFREDLKEEHKRFIKALATWLENKERLLKPTEQPTELERIALDKLAQKGAYFQEIAANTLGADPKLAPKQLRDWVENLSLQQYKVIANNIVKGLYPEADPPQEARNGRRT